MRFLGRNGSFLTHQSHKEGFFRAGKFPMETCREVFAPWPYEITEDMISGLKARPNVSVPGSVESDLYLQGDREGRGLSAGSKSAHCGKPD